MKRYWRGLLIGLTLALASGQAFAQAVTQSGPVVPGHVPVFIANGQVSDGGYVTNPLISSLSINSVGTPFCINDGLTSSPYHQLCIGANNLGTGGLLTYSAKGGASPLPFTLNINGSAYVFNNSSIQLLSLQLAGSNSGVITLLPQANAGTYNFNFPITAGTLNQPLLSGGGGSGPMIWGSISGNTSTFGTTSGVLTNGHCAVFDASGNIIDNGAGCGGSGTVNPGTTGQYAYYASSTNAVSGSSLLSQTGSVVSVSGGLSVLTANQNVVLSPTGTGFVTVNPATLGTIDNVTIGATTSALGTFTSATAKNNLNVGVAGASIGQILVSGNSSGTVTIKPQAAAGTYNFNLPITAGTNGQPLISGGGGGTAMSFGTISGNTSSFATTNGSLTSTHCVNIDVSGNLQDAGAPCANGSGTVNSGTGGQLGYYASSTNAISGNANANISGGALTLGVANSVLGSVSLNGGSSGTILIQPQAAAGSYNFNLPTTAGTSGQPLLSAGGGASPMVYGTLTGNTTKFATASGAYTPGNCVSADVSGNLVDNGTPCGTGGAGTVVSSTATQMAYYPTSTATVAGAPAVTLVGGTVTFGLASTTKGVLKLIGNSSGTITVTPQAAAGTYEFDLPITAGTAGQVLTSQGGAGTAMTWSSPGVAWGGAPQTVAFNAVANTRYCIDTLTTGAVTMTLPTTPADGDQVGWIDCKSNFAVTNFTVARNGKLIMGLSANMTVSTNNAAATFVYSSTLGDWRMF